jgi:hypothetical protein
VLITAGGTAAGPTGIIPVTPATLLMVAASTPVTVVAGQFITISTSVEYDGTGGGTSENITQTIVDQTAAVWDTAVQSVSNLFAEVVGRTIRLGPVGAVGQPAPGTFTYSVNASAATAGPPTVTGSNATIAVMVTSS